MAVSSQQAMPIQHVAAQCEMKRPQGLTGAHLFQIPHAPVHDGLLQVLQDAACTLVTAA